MHYFALNQQLGFILKNKEQTGFLAFLKQAWIRAMTTTLEFSRNFVQLKIEAIDRTAEKRISG